MRTDWKRSGDVLRRYASTAVVKTTSARPKIVRWPTIIAGTEIQSGYGQ